MAGGNMMDSFMDKLAQKLAAQETTKTNASADAGQSSKLKDIAKYYEGLLAKIEQMVDSRPNDTREGVEETPAVTKEELEQMMNQLAHMLNNGLEQSNAITVENSESIKSSVKSVNDKLDAAFGKNAQSTSDEIKAQLEEKTAALQGGLDEKAALVQEEMHKECVKVYRNVQAVVEEGNEKQLELLSQKLKKQNSKLTALTVLAIFTTLASVAGIAFQVLVYLHII